MAKQLYLTEEDLIEGIRTNNHQVVRRAYSLFYPGIEHFITNNSGSIQDAKDLYQEAFIILIQNIQKDIFREESKIKTYLYSICRRQWLKILNSRKHYISDFDDYEDYFEFELHELDELDARKERISRMYSVIKEMGDPCMSIIKRFYLNKQTMSQIAQEMGYTNAENAKNQKYKCFKRLKKLYFSD